MMKNLHGYQEFTVLRNVNDPVLFMGLPLYLALIYLVVIIVACLGAMIMTNVGVPIIINVSISACIGFGGIIAIRTFYKKYGLNGFHFSRKDKVQSNNYECDRSVLDILKSKDNG